MITVEEIAQYLYQQQVGEPDWDECPQGGKDALIQFLSPLLEAYQITVK